MHIDGKKLWIEGGYGLHNNYETSIARVRHQARVMHLPQDELDLILISFFIDLRKDPKMYRVKDNICQQCNCAGNNSGTNAIHYLFRKIQEKKLELVAIEQDLFNQSLNQKIDLYIKEDNERYIKEHGPKEKINLYPELMFFILFLVLTFILRANYGV